MTKQQAYRITHNAIRNGILVRPSSCSRCGYSGTTSDGRSAIQAHHHDYSKPLEVEWICSKCHRKETPKPTWRKESIQRGEKNGSSKLTESDVISARELRLQGWTYQKIADRFSVDKKTAMRAVKGELWKHVSATPQPEKGLSDDS